jgi:peptidyl-prolyl cis-trans isomerase SurA
MKRFLAILFGLTLWLTTSSMLAQSGETIDRIVATVNKQPLLMSDVDESVRVESFLQGRQSANLDPEERKAVLNRLIDRELLLQQMQADYSPADKEVTERVNSIREQLELAGNDEAWQKALAAWGLSAADIEAFVRTQLQVMRFVDLRLRPTIRVDEQAIEEYYRDSLVPEVKKSGAEPEPLQQLRPKIRELLVQQKMDGVLESWLANLRIQSDVHIASDPDAMTGRLVPGGGIDPKSRVADHK